MDQDLVREAEEEATEELILQGKQKQQSSSPTANDFFDLPRQKKDSTVSLSENDVNSPRGAATVVESSA